MFICIYTTRHPSSFSSSEIYAMQGHKVLDVHQPINCGQPFRGSRPYGGAIAGTSPGNSPQLARNCFFHAKKCVQLMKMKGCHNYFGALKASFWIKQFSNLDHFCKVLDTALNTNSTWAPSSRTITVSIEKPYNPPKTHTMYRFTRQVC